MSFQCTVVTPEQQALDESAEQVILPGHDGQVGILTGRAPLLLKLGVGPMRVDLAGGGRKLFLVDGGVAEMKDDVLTVLPTVAVDAEQIDVAAYRAELAKAEGETPTDAAGQADRRRRIAPRQGRRGRGRDAVNASGADTRRKDARSAKTDAKVRSCRARSAPGPQLCDPFAHVRPLATFFPLRVCLCALRAFAAYVSS